MVIAKDKLKPSFLYSFLAQQEKKDVFYPHSSFIWPVFLVWGSLRRKRIAGTAKPETQTTTTESRKSATLNTDLHYNIVYIT